MLIVFLWTRDSCRSIAAFRVTFLAALETTMDRKRFPHNPDLSELIGFMGPSGIVTLSLWAVTSNPRAVDPYHGEGFRLLVYWNDNLRAGLLLRERTSAFLLTE